MPTIRATAVSAMFAALLLAGAAQAQNAPDPAPTDWSAAKTVEVTLADFSFTPKALELRANKPYRLRLMNSAGHGHSFDAPELFAAATIANDDKAKIVKGEIEVEGGQTVDVTFVPNVSGAYKFHCSHFLHSTFGMSGDITVQ